MINYKFLFETLADGVFVAQNYHFVFSNSALPVMLGYTDDEIIGLHFNQVVAPDYLDLWTERFNQCIGVGSEPDKCYEVQFLRKDGTHIWVELRANRADFNERPAVLGTIRDITERKKVKNALSLSEFVIDHSSIEVYRIDSDGHIRYANLKACQSMGYTIEEMQNLSIPDIDPLVQHDQWIAHWQDLLDYKSVFIETTHIRKDGTTRPVEVSANYIKFDGKEYNFAFVRDISERKQSYEALLNKEAILASTIEGSLDGVIHIDADGDITRWNKQSERIFGWTQDEVIGHPIEEIIIPINYREAHKRGMKHYLATGEGPVLNSWVELTALHRDGHEFPVELSISTFILDGIHHFSAFIRDLTDHNLAIQKQIASEKRLRTIIDTEPECVSLITSEGIILEINSAGLSMLEAKSNDQVINLSIYPLIVKQHRQSFIDLNKKVFENEIETGTLEFQLTGLKGGLRWLEIHAGPLTDSDGKVIAVLGIIRDITLKKLSEERVGRLTKLYKAVSEINQAIVRMDDESQLFPLVCRCAVDYGGMSMAWIGRLDQNTQLISPVDSYGYGVDYLKGIVVSSNGSILEGLGPVGIAVRENRPVIINDFFSTSSTLPWQNQAIKFGWQSVGVFPIPRGGNSFGALAVYQTQKDMFDTEVIELFKEMSADIAFAMDNFDRKAKLQSDEDSLKLAASIYEVSSEAMLVIDNKKMVIAINPAFTSITGFSENEIIGMSVDTLRTNYHDEAFYQKISEELDLKGKWQGELWFNRKNGEAYPTLAIINSVFDINGSVLRRVYLFNDISQKKETEEFIWRQANYDLLTGLPNRLMFHDRVEQEFKKTFRTKLPFALLFLDLDNFKEVNDTLGHAYGDMLLRNVSQRILTCVRATDTIARFGGDEFTILLTDITEKERVNRVIEDILQNLSTPFELNDETVYITASVGVTCYPDDGEDLETLTKNADQAMYAAKNAGRNGYSYFTKSMQETAQTQMRLANDLRQALSENQFWVEYQPIINLKSGKITKAEALVRWQHPKLGLVSPAEFIPIAEQTGIINDIGEYVFIQAATQVKRLQDVYDKEFQISVNVSPVQFNNTRAKYGAWRKKFNNLGLNGKSIVVEITEGLLLEANNLIKEKLIEFSNAGIQIAIDDFGTGYSSLSYLKKFEIDYIKIDQSFVRNMTANSGDYALCEAMVVMAHKLGIEVIAEGVETPEQSKLLTEMGCDFAQGYYFAKPMLENVILDWVKKFKLD